MCDAQQEMTLEQWVDRLPGFHFAHREYDLLIAKVEELEADCAVKDDIIQGCGHVLTDEMIDEAVDSIESTRDYTAKAQRDARWKPLNKLHIFRCGEPGCPLDGGHYPGCDCNGRGWKIGGEGD